MKRHGKLIGSIIACSGVVVILSLILPTTFWWFILGIFLISVGITVMKRC